MAVAIPYWIASDGSKFVCLVTSRKHDNLYVLPKGGVEKGETSREAAVREMWEEAGLRSASVLPADQHSHSAHPPPTTTMATVADHKAHKKSPVSDNSSSDFIPRAVYEAHEVEVRKGDALCESADWPERKERQRRWVPLQEACDLIAWRRDIHQLLLQSSLVGR